MRRYQNKSQHTSGNPATQLPVRSRRCSALPANRGISLIEIMLVLTIMGVLVASAAPSFRRNMEQSRADIAGANLRTIWTAQRLYWLDYRTYTDSLTELESLNLIDPTIVAASEPYNYRVYTTPNTFSAEATRSGSNRWGGTLVIDETGVFTGSIFARGETPIEPGFLH